MPTVQDLKAKFQQMREAVEAAMPDIAAAVSLSGKALAERRIKAEGFGAEYKIYHVPAFFFEGRELNQQGTSWLEAKKKKDAKNRPKKVDGQMVYPDDWGVDWAGFREAQGLQIYHVDLTYKGFMWSNMQPIRVEQTGTVTVSILGGTNTETQNEMNYNRDRYGDFISRALNDNDKKTLQQVVADTVAKVLEPFKP